MVSLFTTNSGKTNLSAPVGNDNGENSSMEGGPEGNSGNSPLHSKFKESQITGGDHHLKLGSFVIKK